MRSRISWLAAYFLLWGAWFEGSRLVFLWYQFVQQNGADPANWLPILGHGLRMDLSVAGYLTLLPGFWLAFAPARWLFPVIRPYSSLMVIVVSFLTTVDLELYRAWGFRLDTTPLRYLSTPNEAFASIGSSPLGWLAFILILLTITGAALFLTVNRWFSRQPGIAYRSPFEAVPLVLATAGLIIPIRGGLQLAPMNVSAVYFSRSLFDNHAAINPQWNFIFSVLERPADNVNPFAFLPENQARQNVQHLYEFGARAKPVLKTRKPNIVLIIWESLTAKAVAGLGGRTGITPQFERLSQEGLLFSQLYASGDRSDKGLVAVLSGFPAQPTASIMTIPGKAAKLPTLSQHLKKAGYETSFYYGGETEFANIKSYLLNSQYDRIVSKADFNSSDWNSKWGAHDHVVYDRLLQDLNRQQKPFFATFFTLSSHEPFETPVPTVISGADEESRFLNAMHYADQSFGRFIEEAKKQPWWDNTLIVVVADHGHRLPVLSPDKVANFHIPMLWLGGALKASSKVIGNTGSQTDLAATLLNQLRLDGSAFRFSRDLLAPCSRPFAYFAFNNGFGLVQPDRWLIFDNESRQVSSSRGKVTQEDVEVGEAYEAISYGEFLIK
ncbi:LTA synthase family protein [Tellurirhabdus rosea]|uniref:LTA synthase family protein n=1 Tax=Tellurirhabdus rosea TaxID=2674997 RepID=UPI00224D773E|nr:alkaline phosphatase family protein [Tellurirhabdus rosea]